MGKSNEFKASTVELATKNGLEEMGLSAEEAEIEVLARGGIFSKAIVRITPKAKEETIDDVSAESEDAEAIETAVSEEIAENTEEDKGLTEEKKAESEETAETPEEREARFQAMKSFREPGKTFISEVANLMGANITVECKIKEDEVCFYIGGEDARMFIGYKGETLEATQTLLGQYLNSGRENRIRVIVDADFYRERRKRTLVALAKKLAKQAYNQHKEIALEPMNSYERRIIHSALQNSYDATTRSDGEGKARHVVIVPKSGLMTYGNSSDFKKKGPTKTKSFGYNKKRF